MHANSGRRPGSVVTDRRGFLGGLAAACAAALPGRLGHAQAADAPNPPNVVLIISDDQAWGDYGFMGHPVVRTPNIDRLAARSALYTRCCNTSPLCCPSLASMITGLHPWQNGITSNDPPAVEGKASTFSPAWSEERLALRREMEALYRQVPTLPRMLAEKGYLSFQAGKWWGGDYQNGGFTHGMTHGDFERGGRHGDEGLKIGRETMAPVHDFLDGVGEKPFFLWFAPMMPHSPHNPPDRLLDYYREKTDSIHVARYWAMCEWWDEVCGDLLQKLDDMGATENTLIVYLADNGWFQDESGPRFAPKSKTSPYEGGLRTPLLLSGPGIEARRDDTPISTVDIVATVRAAAGLEPGDDLPGLDLRDPRGIAERDTVFASVYTHNAVDIHKPAENLRFLCAISGQWKLILPTALEPEAVVELYDVVADPYEEINLAEARPDRVNALREKIRAWWPEGEARCIRPESA